MLRRICTLMLITVMLALVLAAPAAAQERRVLGRYQDRYTVYEERRPGDPNRYLIYVEDGALGGQGARLLSRGSGIEGIAFSAATLLFAASAFAVYRRNSLLKLLHA